MRRYRIPLSILGFILQILFLFFVTRRTNYWGNIGQYFIILSILILFYSAFIDKKSTIKRYCIQYSLMIVAAIFLSGLLSALGFSDIVSLLFIGIVISTLVVTILYHIVRIFVPGSLQEEGFDYFLEISLTFFSCAVYPTLLFISLSTVNIIVFTLVILAISILIALTLVVPVNRSTDIIVNEIKSWHSINELSPIQLAIIKRLLNALNDFLVNVKESFNALTTMGGDIKTTSEDLSTASEQMNASLQEVSSTIQQISMGTQDQSSAITSIAHAIEQLNNLTASISSQVKMASVSSRRTTSSAKRGMELSKKEASITREIFEQTEFIQDKMSALRDQATEIKKILDIIVGITEQTDLLALNAAIEAARVGEQGRGFAVVADEIRNLANETQRSSSVVENLILEINTSIEGLSTLLISERDKMTESNELAAQTELQFTGIVKAVDLVTDMISRINQAAANQADHAKELVKQVEQIAQVANSTAAATEEVSAAVQEQTASMQEFTSTAQVLSSFATKLDELLKKLKK